VSIPVVLRANSGALTVDLEAAPASVTGTVAVTEANDTPTASGTITITGTSATAEANDTPTASGTITITGTSATTEALDTSTASGTVEGGETPPAGGRPRFTYERVPAPVARNDDDDILLLIAL
jgi:hypothetical protein